MPKIQDVLKSKEFISALTIIVGLVVWGLFCSWTAGKAVAPAQNVPAFLALVFVPGAMVILMMGDRAGEVYNEWQRKRADAQDMRFCYSCGMMDTSFCGSTSCPRYEPE